MSQLFFENFLVFWCNEMSQTHLVHTSTCARTKPLSTEPRLLGEQCSEATARVSGCFQSLSFASRPFQWKALGGVFFLCGEGGEKKIHEFSAVSKSVGLFLLKFREIIFSCRVN